MTTEYPEYGSKEFYQEKAALVEGWAKEYVELMFPSDEKWRTSTPQQLERMTHTARVRACWILEMVMQFGLTDKLVDLIASQSTKAEAA